MGEFLPNLSLSLSLLLTPSSRKSCCPPSVFMLLHTVNLRYMMKVVVRKKIVKNFPVYRKWFATTYVRSKEIGCQIKIKSFSIASKVACEYICKIAVGKRVSLSLFRASEINSLRSLTHSPVQSVGRPERKTCFCFFLPLSPSLPLQFTSILLKNTAYKQSQRVERGEGKGCVVQCCCLTSWCGYAYAYISTLVRLLNRQTCRSAWKKGDFFCSHSRERVQK